MQYFLKVTQPVLSSYELYGKEKWDLDRAMQTNYLHNPLDNVQWIHLRDLIDNVSQTSFHYAAQINFTSNVLSGMVLI